jgi:hypothetical protein
LVIRPGAIGDCVVSLPAIQYLAPDEIWAPAANLPLLKHIAPGHSIVSTGLDLLEIPGGGSHALETLAGFTEIVSWYGAARPEFRRAVAGLPFRFYPALPDSSGIEHATDFYLRQVGAPSGAVPRLPVEHRPLGYTVIHPFSGSARKNWPLEAFRTVAAALPEPVYWCAGPDETLDQAYRFNDLGDLARWLVGASLYLGNDSGITHLAAACGVPVVAVFTVTDPAVWAPRGPAVEVLRNPMPAEVVKACSRLRTR